MKSMMETVNFKCNLLSCLHSEDKKLAFDHKKQLSLVGCFSVKVDHRARRFVIRAVYSVADRNDLQYFAKDDFELILESDKLPVHRYNDNQEIMAFGRLQTINYHEKDKFCESCKQNPTALYREKELHDIVCHIEESSIKIYSQQDCDFSIVF